MENIVQNYLPFLYASPTKLLSVVVAHRLTSSTDSGPLIVVQFVNFVNFQKYTHTEMAEQTITEPMSCHS